MTNSITARAAFDKKCKHKDEFIAAMKIITEFWGGGGGVYTRHISFLQNSPLIKWSEACT